MPTYVRFNFRFIPFIVLLGLYSHASIGWAQQNERFETLFTRILVSVDPFKSVSNPFGDDVTAANADLVPSLNLLFASRISSLPLTSSISVNEYESNPFTTVESKREPLGPLFAENAITIGKGNVDLGFNVTAFSINEFRGRALDDLTFVFAPSLNDVRGDELDEHETLSVTLDMAMDVQLYVLTAAYGLTPKLDIGFALPYVNLDMLLNATGVLSRNSTRDYAFYSFDDQHFTPLLEKTFTTGSMRSHSLGDLSIRLKYVPLDSVVDSVEVNEYDQPFLLGFLADVRLPTGSEDYFMSTGAVNATLMSVLQKRFGKLTPHLNMAYEYRGAGFDSDEIDVTVGAGWKVANPLDVLVDARFGFDLSRNERLESLSDFEDVIFPIFRRSNIPMRRFDSSVVLSAGIKYAPNLWFSSFANVLVPLSNSGVTYRIAPTFGIFINFSKYNKE